MTIISIEIMKVVDKREKYNTRCVVIRQSNSEV